MKKLKTLKTRTRSIIACLLLLLTLQTIFVQTSIADDAPLAELYFYNHGQIGALSALNTTTYKALTQSSISNAGYNCHAYTNVKAGPKKKSSVIRTLASDAIFFINAHGNHGRVVCVDNNNNVTRVSAKKHFASTTYSLEYNFENTTDQLKTIRIAYWMGCNTYGTDANFGSLNNKCADLGIDAVITHNDNVFTQYGTYFMYRFAYYGDQGQSVGVALVNAKSNTLSNFLGTAPYDTTSDCYRTVNSYKITGANLLPSLVKFEPAGYGTY